MKFIENPIARKLKESQNKYSKPNITKEKWSNRSLKCSDSNQESLVDQNQSYTIGVTLTNDNDPSSTKAKTFKTSRATVKLIINKYVIFLFYSISDKSETLTTYKLYLLAINKVNI